MIVALAPELYVFAAFVTITVLVVGGVRELSRRNRKQLEGFAERANLQILERSILGFTSVESLEGEQHSRAIRYWTYSTGSGKSRTSWIAVGVRPRGHGFLEFELVRQGLGTKIMEWFGAREIQVGDRAFDDQWFVRTNEPEFFAPALLPEIRGRLMAAPERSGSRYKLAGDIVHYAEQGYFDGHVALERLETHLPLLHELADIAEVFAASRERQVRPTSGPGSAG